MKKLLKITLALFATILLTLTPALAIAPMSASAAAPEDKILFEDHIPGIPSTIAMINPDGTGYQSLGVYGTSPKFSPDGTKIAYTAEPQFGAGTDIFVMDIDGSNQINLTPNTIGTVDADADWSPDGTKLAFGKSVAFTYPANPGIEGIYIMNADGSNQHPAVTGSHQFGPSWSPDGTKLAFNTAGPGGNAIAFANVNGSNLFTWGVNTSRFPKWSSDNRILRERMCGCEQPALLTISDPDASMSNSIDIARVMYGSVASWSPDASKIVYMTSNFLLIIDSHTGAIQTFNTGNLYATSATWGVINQVPVQKLTALSPAQIWLGLKNGAEAGIKFDLRAEAYKDGVLVSSGELSSVPAGGNGFNNANLNAIPFDPFAPVNFPAGSALSIKLYVRNACVDSGHKPGTARLWFNDSAANSQFGATVDANATNYYLRDGFVLANTAGPGPQKTIDVQSGAACSPFKQFGSWSVTP